MTRSAHTQNNSTRPHARGSARHSRDGGLSRRELQRARIITAMTVAIAREGIERASISHVLAGAHIPRAAFYQQFEDREDCLRAVLDQHLDRARGQIQQGAVRQGTWLEQVRSGLRALLEHFDAEPDAARFLVIHSRHPDPEMARTREQALRELARIVGEGAATDAKRPQGLTAEATVAGVLGVIEARLEDGSPPLSELAGPLMSFIVAPYLGDATAREELKRNERRSRGRASRTYAEVGTMRITYRTVRALAVIGREDGLSNLQIAERAGITDQGQVSKLLKRLEALDLVENTGEGANQGKSNAWQLTAQGRSLERRLGVDAVTNGARPA